MLSPTGHCHAFDVAADGFVSAEASVMFMMKRLDDAQRDGDRILAVIRGTASNQDGHTVNIATPGADAQVAVYRRALAWCEAPTYRERSRLLAMLLDALPRIPDRVALWRRGLPLVVGLHPADEHERPERDRADDELGAADADEGVAGDGRAGCVEQFYVRAGAR